MEVSEKMPFLWQKQDSDRSRSSRQEERAHSYHSTEKELARDIIDLVGKTQEQQMYDQCLKSKQNKTWCRFDDLILTLCKAL